MDLRIGVDDTDSVRGMCTTYLAYAISRGLLERGAEFAEYPSLVRLNPNIPWRTRGNGAVSLHVRTGEPDRVRRFVADTVASRSMGDANPGVAFLEGDSVPREIAGLARRALWGVVEPSEALGAARRAGMDTTLMGTGRGIVGAVAALGHEFGDSTAELIAYRREGMVGTPRRIDARSVARMQERTYPHTFCSYDEAAGRVLVAPRGPDPVFFGLRGESPRVLCRAAGMLSYGERLLGHMIFRTNQGTGEHLDRMLDGSTFRPHESGLVRGEVLRAGRPAAGGHASFEVSMGRRTVTCWAYRPTGLQRAVAGLAPGDGVVVGGGVRAGSRGNPDTLSAELLRVTRLADVVSYRNPSCARCNKSMKSEGRAQGYACPRCGDSFPYRIPVPVRRSVRVGEYIPNVSAHRHLSRPAQRRGRTNRIRFDGSVPWLLVC